MGSLTDVVQQLRKERDRAQKEVHRIDAALAALGNLSVNGAKSRTFSAATRRRMAISQKARWAKRAANGQAAGNAKPKRALSAAGRKRIAAAQRKRWAKVKRASKA
jgi:hypothetical protein